MNEYPKNTAPESRLRECPACGKQLSRMAAQCPNCGHPFAPADAARGVQTTERTSKKWKAIMAGGGLLTIVGILCLTANFPMGLWIIAAGIILMLIGRTCAWWFNG